MFKNIIVHKFSARKTQKKFNIFLCRKKTYAAYRIFVSGLARINIW